MFNIINDKSNIHFPIKNAVSLGAFDGLHRGHMLLIDNIKNYAKAHDLATLIYTFDRHPAVLKGYENMKYITPTRVKTQIMQDWGVDYLYLQTLSPEVMAMSADDFITHVLADTLNAGYVCVGENFRFGSGATGDTQYLRKRCGELGIDCDVMPLLSDDGQTISASSIRYALEEGDVTRTNRLLGRMFFIEGTVQHGHKRGRLLGFSTTNLSPDEDQIVPARGVYASYVTLGGKRYKAVTNVGIAPTFEVNHLIVESHIFEFNYDIYGSDIRVEFFRRIRPEKHFASVNDLKIQILRDKEFALSIL